MREAELIQVWYGLLSAKLKIAMCSYSKIRKDLGKPTGKNQDSHLDSNSSVDCSLEIVKVQQLIATAERFLPFKCQCLVVAIVAHRLLKKRGVPSRLYLGVFKGRLNLKAHAWVQVGEIPVVGVFAGGPQYTVVQIFE